MNSMVSKLRSPRKPGRYMSFITAVALTASLIIGCETNVQPPPTVVSPPNQEAIAATPTDIVQDRSMVLVPAGNYTVGSDETEDTQPVHQLSLSAFQIDRYEVSNVQYAEFLNSLNIQPLQDAASGEVRPSNLPEEAIPLLIEGSEGSQQQPLIALDDEHTRIAIQNGQFVPQSGYENHPVTETTWHGANEFCVWRGARLPTEVEWEAAARGLAGRIYPWGSEPPTPDRAVYGRSSGETEPIGTHPLGSTPDGVHDLAGNVSEWTSTLYRPYPYKSDDGREQLDSVGERVTRGGDHVFNSAQDELTTYFRTGFSRAPDRGHRHIGFRCAQTLS